MIENLGNENPGTQRLRITSDLVPARLTDNAVLRVFTQPEYNGLINAYFGDLSDADYLLVSEIRQEWLRAGYIQSKNGGGTGFEITPAGARYILENEVAKKATWGSAGVVPTKINTKPVATSRHQEPVLLSPKPINKSEVRETNPQNIWRRIQKMSDQAVGQAIKKIAPGLVRNYLNLSIRNPLRDMAIDDDKDRSLGRYLGRSDANKYTQPSGELTLAGARYVLWRHQVDQQTYQQQAASHHRQPPTAEVNQPGVLGESRRFKQVITGLAVKHGIPGDLIMIRRENGSNDDEPTFRVSFFIRSGGNGRRNDVGVLVGTQEEIIAIMTEDDGGKNNKFLQDIVPRYNK